MQLEIYENLPDIEDDDEFPDDDEEYPRDEC